MKKPSSSEGAASSIETKQTISQIPDDVEIVRFWDAPPGAYFDQRTMLAVLRCSAAKLERDRWLGIGLPYSRFGRRVLYKKADVVALLERNKQAPESRDAG